MTNISGHDRTPSTVLSRLLAVVVDMEISHDIKSEEFGESGSNFDVECQVVSWGEAKVPMR